MAELITARKALAILACLALLGSTWVWLDHPSLSVASLLLRLWVLVIVVGVATTFTLSLVVTASSTLSPSIGLTVLLALSIPTLYGSGLLITNLSAELWLACQHSPRLEPWLPAIIASFLVGQFYILTHRAPGQQPSPEQGPA